MRRWRITTLLMVIVAFASYGQTWTTPSDVREIAAPQLQDIAMASFDAYGPVIYYNPTFCHQAGTLATAFMRAHEYGHHYLGHVVLKLWDAKNPYVQAWLNANSEDRADTYAVDFWLRQVGGKSVIQAGANLMWSLNNAGDNTHRPSRVRAKNIIDLFYLRTGTPLFP